MSTKKFLTKKEMFAALLDGKKIKPEGWNDSEYCFIDDYGDLVDERGDKLSIKSIGDKVVIHEEPKKKVELFLWAQYNGDDCYHTICNKFMDEDHATMYLGKNAIKTNVSIMVEV